MKLKFYTLLIPRLTLNEFLYGKINFLPQDSKPEVKTFGLPLFRAWSHGLVTSVCTNF